MAAAGEIKLPAGAVEDGMVKNHAATVMALNRLLASLKTRAGSAVMTFTSQSLLSRRLSLPVSKPKQLAMMVRNEMIQVVNDASEYIYEYSVCRESTAKNGMIDVWAYAFSRETVDEYQILFKSLKLRPVALDVHSNAAEKLFIDAVVNGESVGAGSMIFACVERSTVEMHLFSGGDRVFTRISLLSSHELELILRNAGVHGGEENFFDGVDLCSDRLRGDSIITDARNHYVMNLSDEINKMLQFQLRRDASVPVTEVYLCGPMADLKGLDSEVAAVLGLKTECIDSILGVKADFPINRYVHAIGSLIRL